MNIQKWDFNKEAASWDEVPSRVKLAHDIAKAIPDEVTLTSDADVLDFGCGTGLLSLQFHENNDGIFHFGFERAILLRVFMEAGFDDIRDRTAAEVIKPIPGGGKRVFTVFLMTGRKILKNRQY